MAMSQNTPLTLGDRWDDILYNLIDYPSIELIIKDSIVLLPFLGEELIKKILLSGV